MAERGGRERGKESKREVVGGEVKGGMFFAQALHINTLHYLDLGDTDLVSHVERERG